MRLEDAHRRHETTTRLLLAIVVALGVAAAVAGISAIAGTTSTARTATGGQVAARRSGGAAQVLWTGDAERPLGQQWAELSTATHCAVITDEAASDPEAFRESTIVAQGFYAYEFVARPADGNRCYGGERTELGQGLPGRPGFTESRQFNQGAEVWISFQFRLGADFPIENPNWDVIAQWKQNASSTVVPGPMLALQVYRGKLWLVAAGGTADPRVDDTRSWPLTRVRTGRWIKISMHIKFDTNPGIGFVEVFGDPGGVGMHRLFRLRHMSTLATDGSGNWVPSNARIGIYRNAVIPGTAHLYYDGYTAATARAAAEANAFAPPRPRTSCLRRARSARLRRCPG